MTDVPADVVQAESDIARAPTPPGSDAEGRRRAVVVPAIIGCALFMQQLDQTSMANALPTIAHALSVSPLELNLAITVYMLSAAIFLPISGWAADRFGARTVFVSAIILFAVSALFTGFSANLPHLLIGRVLQGGATAMMVPVGRLVLLRTVPKSELVGALSVLTMPGLLGPVIGPPLGGLIVTFADWRWIFFMNVPIAILGVFLTLRFIPNVKEDVSDPLDWRGFLLTAIACGGIVYGFSSLGRGGLPVAWAIGLVTIGFAALAAFRWHAKRTDKPILDLSIFNVPSFNASVVGGAFFRFAVGATPFMMALLLQTGLGMSALQAGFVTFAGAAGSLAMKTVAPPIIKRYGFRKVLLVNGVIAGAAFAFPAFFNAQTPYWLMISALLIGGFFRSLQFTSLNALGYADVESERMSRASSMASMGQQLSQTIGVGLAGILIHATMAASGADHLTLGAIAPTFVMMAFVSFIAHAFYVRLPENAGDEVAGRPARA